MATQEQRFIIEVTENHYIKGGKAIRDYINGLPIGRHVVSIKKYKKQRSLSQNSYYHSCVVPAVKDGLIDAGFDRHLLNSETVHEMLKNKFLKEEVPNDDGLFIEMVRSTSSLTTTEFMNYIDDIQRWASEFLNIYIASPNEQSELNF